MIDIFNNFYKGKKVLVTGHTGFKGSWLSIWLHEQGAEVVGLSLDSYSEKDNYTNKNGEKVYSVQIIAEEIEFAERKGSGQTSGGAPEPSEASNDFMNIPDGVEEGLPFN